MGTPVKIYYPDSIDPFNLPRSRAEKNTDTALPAIERGDEWYILQELEKKVGSTDSTDPSSHDYRIAALESLITQLQSGVARSSAVLASGTDVLFATTFTLVVLAINVISCKNGSGEDVGIDITNVTQSGFTATPYEDATLIWQAVLQQ